jgi:resuscitation-promoting factor RpfA
VHPRAVLSLIARSALLLLVGTSALRALWELCSAPAAMLGGELVSSGPGALAGLSFEQALTGGCAAVLIGCAVWLVAVGGLAVVSQLARALCMTGDRSGRPLDPLARMADRMCPSLVRAVVAAALGGTVAAAIAPPAPADPPGGDPVSTGLSGLAVPDRTVGAPGEPVPHRRTPLRRPATMVVASGDSLWSMTAALLPDHASDRDITHGWHRLYRANASRIGPDPDLLLPGTPLVVPRLEPTRRKDLP